MNSTYRCAVRAALVLTTFSWAAQAARAADNTTLPLTIQFSETLHVRDQQTVVDKMNGSLTEHVSSEGGAVRIDAAVHLDRDITVEPSTPIEISAGNFKLCTTLAADPNYHAGMRQANIALAAPTGSGKSSVFYGHVKI